MDESFDGDGDGPARALRQREIGWAVLDAAAADGTPVALVGPLVHLEQGERAHVVGTWVNDSRYGAQVKVSQATPAGARGSRRAGRLTCGASSTSAPSAPQSWSAAYGAAEVLDEIDADPLIAFGRVGLRGDAAREAADSWQTTARHPAPAPAAGAARARVSRAPDPRPLRRRRARGGQPQPVRADERVRRRLPDRRSDCARTGDGGAGERVGEPSASVRRSCTCWRRRSAAAAPACRSPSCSRRPASCSASRRPPV